MTIQSDGGQFQIFKRPFYGFTHYSLQEQYTEIFISKNYISVPLDAVCLIIM